MDAQHRTTWRRRRRLVAGWVKNDSRLFWKTWGVDGRAGSSLALPDGKLSAKETRMSAGHPEDKGGSASWVLGPLALESSRERMISGVLGFLGGGANKATAVGSDRVGSG